MSEQQQRFITLLTEIFELNKRDLDFGIYRVLNLRRNEIMSFFKEKLPAILNSELRPVALFDTNVMSARMAEIESQLGGADMIAQMSDNIPLVREYRDLQKSSASGADLASMETEVYTALYTFFSRYYDEGDFISKRRYKDGVYAIPYEGEEVKLYWANQDQYYIKTSENFRDYTFKADDDLTVHFKLVDATTEQNNNKEKDDEKRVFMLFEEIPEKYPGLTTFQYDEDLRSLTIRFIYDVPFDKRVKYADENARKITQYIEESLPELVPVLLEEEMVNGKKKGSLLMRHLKSYIGKNSFDYFIHKDLKGFLSRELDFFIKNEVLNIEDFETDNLELNRAYFAKIRAIAKVAFRIIEFLAQIENFQKKLWLKKKYIVDTNWCITLDLVDERFYPEIASNVSQTEDWIRLFAIDKIEGRDGTPSFSIPLTVEFLKSNQNLVLDTCHFSEDFKNRLIASLENLDERTNGLLIHGDNFHALRLLSCSLKDAVRTIYIDPPYNSTFSVIPYKNSYKHSSWLSLLQNRISQSLPLLDDKGSLVVAIDENEHVNLTCMMRDMMRSFDITTVSVEHNKKGIQGDHFSFTNEFAVFAVPYARKTLNLKNRSSEEWDWSQFRNWGDESLRSDAANCFYPVYVKDNEIIGCGDVCDDTFHPRVNETIKGPFSIYDHNGERREFFSDGGVTAVYPIDDNNIERKWRYAAQTFYEVSGKLRVRKKKVEGKNVLSIEIAKTQDQFKTLWSSPIYNAGDYGTKLLTNMGFRKSDFKFPKSVFTTLDCIYAVSDNDSVILDYFAGSGTTAHAVIRLNRRDKESHRKYILTEMGEYFYSVTKPRVLKALYSDQWKNGIPTDWKDGVSQIVKYIHIESYEDALNNISLSDSDRDIFGSEDYLVNYMFSRESTESMMNTRQFKEPFNTKMSVTERNERRTKRVDIIGTFSYLIGLKVELQSDVSLYSVDIVEGRYRVAEALEESGRMYKFQHLVGRLPDGRKALVIWRNISDDILESNEALYEYFRNTDFGVDKRDLDVLYVNGDSSLESYRQSSEHWVVMLTDLEFVDRMWKE